MLKLLIIPVLALVVFVVVILFNGFFVKSARELLHRTDLSTQNKLKWFMVLLIPFFGVIAYKIKKLKESVDKKQQSDTE